MRAPRFDPLFQPLKNGPVTAPNRFWQVPHCTGMGNRHPQSVAAMRGVKAHALMTEAVAEAGRGSCSVWPGEYHLANGVGS